MGDGALVEFASVVDAVECAAAIQNGVAERQAELPEDRRIAFRIGINIGDVIVEEDDIYGDGVNVAARLEALAEPGEICVARNVYNQVKSKLAFGFEPMGEHRVKNIPEPVTVYRVITEPGPIAKVLGLKRAGTPTMAPRGARRGGGRAPGRSRRRRAVAALGRQRAAGAAAGRDAGDDLRGARRARSRRLWTSTASRCCRSRTSAPIPRTSTSPTA